MSMIINTETKAYEEQSHRRYPQNWNGDGWIAVPPVLEPRARAYCPYCELEIEDGALVGITPTERPEPEPEPDYEAQIATLKEGLSATDYKIIKCSEAQLVGEELPYNVTELHTERQALRDQINQLEALIAGETASADTESTEEVQE